MSCCFTIFITLHLTAFVGLAFRGARKGTLEGASQVPLHVFQKATKQHRVWGSTNLRFQWVRAFRTLWVFRVSARRGVGLDGFSKLVEVGLAMVGATPEMRWWSANTVAVITGSNKGVGLEISKQLARNGLTTVMTARDESRGRKAVEDLRKEVGSDRIAFHPLDVCSEESATALAKWLEETYGGADILINNAGYLDNDETPETAVTTIRTNYYGVKNVTKTLLPILRLSPAGARVIMVSSELGQLQALRNHYRTELAKRDELTEEKLDAFVAAFLEERKTGQGPGGWPHDYWSPSYCISKMALNGYMSVLARELSRSGRDEGSKVYVNSFTPGYTSTSMTRNQGHSVEDGAITGIWLALHPAEGHPQGKFWAAKCRGEMPF